MTHGVYLWRDAESGAGYVGKIERNSGSTRQQRDAEHRRGATKFDVALQSEPGAWSCVSVCSTAGEASSAVVMRLECLLVLLLDTHSPQRLQRRAGRHLGRNEAVRDGVNPRHIQDVSPTLESFQRSMLTLVLVGCVALAFAFDDVNEKRCEDEIARHGCKGPRFDLAELFCKKIIAQKRRDELLGVVNEQRQICNTCTLNVIKYSNTCDNRDFQTATNSCTPISDETKRKSVIQNITKIFQNCLKQRVLHMTL